MVDRTELEIGLKDSISPQLKEIGRQLRELNKMAREAGDQGANSISKIKDQQLELARSSREALRNFVEMGSSIIDFTKDLFGIGGVAASLHQFVTGIYEFAKGRVQLENFAKDTAFATEDISELTDAMELMGIETEQAHEYISRLGTSLQELRAYREGSPLFERLEKMGQYGAELGRRLLGDVKVGNYKKAVEDILDFYQKQSPEAQYYLSQALGVPQSVLSQLREFQELTEETYDGDINRSRQTLINIGLFRQRLRSEWNRIADHILEDVNKVWADINERYGGHALSDWINGEWNKLIKGYNDTVRQISTAKKFLEEHLPLRPGAKSIWDDPDKHLDVSRENNKLLRDINELLKPKPEGASGSPYEAPSVPRAPVGGGPINVPSSEPTPSAPSSPTPPQNATPSGQRWGANGWESLPGMVSDTTRKFGTGWWTSISPEAVQTETSRDMMDGFAIGGRGSSSVIFDFRNVPNNVRTNADQTGFDSMEVNRSRAVPSISNIDQFNSRFDAAFPNR